MKQFCKIHKITARFEWWHENPHMADSSDMYHFRVTMKRERKTMSLYFSVGRGWTEAQRDALSDRDVLNCLARDAAGVENSTDFADWCAELGYSDDSRKAEKIYKTCKRQAAKLKAFLGSDLYETLLWSVESE